MKLYKHYSLNTQGKDFVCGDIHGCFERMHHALDQLNFNYDTDRLFVCGDLIDRGPQCDQTLNYLTQPWFHAVMGNHDWMLIAASKYGQVAKIWNQNGNRWWYQNPNLFEHYDIWQQQLAKLPLAIEVQTSMGKIGIAHANIIGRDWNNFIEILDHNEIFRYDDGGIVEEISKWYVNNDEIMNVMWDRTDVDLFKYSQNFNNARIGNIHHVFFGHTIFTFPLTIANRSYIDTGCFITKDRVIGVDDIPLRKSGGLTVLPIEKYLQYHSQIDVEPGFTDVFKICDDFDIWCEENK